MFYKHSRIVYPMAGGLILAGFLLFWLLKPGKVSVLESEWFQPEREKLGQLLNQFASFGFAAVPQTKEDSLALSYMYFEEQRYQDAKELFQQILNHHPGELEVRFYLGLSHLYAQSPETAYEILYPLVELEQFDLQDDAAWYAALAASSTQPEKATVLFQRLSHDPSSKYRNAAEAVLDSTSGKSGRYNFQAGTDPTLKSSLTIIPGSEWWQEDWIRALLSGLFPGLGLYLLFHRFRQNRTDKRFSGGLQKDEVSPS